MSKPTKKIVFFNHNLMSLGLNVELLEAASDGYCEFSKLPNNRAGDPDDQILVQIRQSRVAIEHGNCLSGNHGQGPHEKVGIAKWAQTQNQLKLVVVTLSSVVQTGLPRLVHPGGPVLLWAQDAKGDALAVTETSSKDVVAENWKSLIPLISDYDLVCAWIGGTPNADLDKFFRPKSLIEYSTALSLLCQGYLAQYALSNRTNGGVNLKGCADVGKALKEMGWVEDEAAEMVCQIVGDLDLDCGQPPPGIEFWTDPFEDSKSLRDGIQSELPMSLPKIPNGVEDLLKAIEENNVSNKSFVSIVAKAHLELSRFLEAA